MRHSRTNTTSVSNGDEDKGFNDVLFGAIGLVIMVLVVALAMIGVPEVSQGKLKEMEARLAESLDAHAAAMAKFENEKRRSDQLDDLAKSLRREKYLAEEKAAREERERKEAEVDAQRQKKAREKADRQRRGAEKAREEAEKAKSDLEPKPVDFVVVIDGTISMGPVLDECGLALRSIAEIGSRLSPRFRLGIVIFRRRGSIEVFPLTEIGPSIGSRKSKGMKKLIAFVEDETVEVSSAIFDSGSEEGVLTGKKYMASKMEPLGGFADIEGGMKEGVKILQGSARPGSRQVLFVMGDVGPWEMGDPGRIEASDHKIADRMRSSIQGFTRNGEDSRVLALFTGKSMKDLAFRKETIAFFQSLAKSAGSKGSYSDEISQLTAQAIEAIFNNQSQ